MNLAVDESLIPVAHFQKVIHFLVIREKIALFFLYALGPSQCIWGPISNEDNRCKSFWTNIASLDSKSYMFLIGRKYFKDCKTGSVCTRNHRKGI